MWVTKNFLDAMAREDETENYTDSNDDHDFGKVLEFCKSTGPVKERKIRYSDGLERHFSFGE